MNDFIFCFRYTHKGYQKSPKHADSNVRYIFETLTINFGIQGKQAVLKLNSLLNGTLYMFANNLYIFWYRFLTYGLDD